MRDFIRTLTPAGILLFLSWLALCLIPMLSPHIYTAYLWRAPVPENTNVWEGFRSIGLHLVDIPLVAVLLVAVLLLIGFRAEHDRFGDSLRMIVEQYGGFWWAAFLVWMAFSILAAGEPLLAFYNTAHLAAELFIALWIADMVRRSYDRGLLLAFMLAGVVHSGLGLAQVIKGESLGLTWLGETQRSPINPYGFGPQTFRGAGLAFHPNNLGGFLLIAVFTCLMLLRETRSRGQIVAGATAGIIIILGLMATVSRGAIVAATVMVPIAAGTLFFKNVRDKYRYTIIAIPLLAFVLIVAGVLLVGGSFGESMIDRLGGWIRDPESFGERLTFAFPDTIAVIRSSPVMGTGAGNLMVKVGELRAGSGELLLPAHNVYPVMWAEAGIVGLALFIGGNLFILAHLHPCNHAGVTLWGWAFAALVIAMIADFYFWGDLRSRVLIFWVIGMWWGYSLQQHDSVIETG